MTWVISPLTIFIKAYFWFSSQIFHQKPTFFFCVLSPVFAASFYGPYNLKEFRNFDKTRAELFANFKSIPYLMTWVTKE